MLLSKYVFIFKNRTSVSLLKSNSNKVVSCRCNSCGKKYLQRFSRDKEVCSTCRKSENLKNNSLGHKNRKNDIPLKHELLSFSGGKKSIADYYSVSISVVNGWLKHHSIELEKYKGVKKTIPDDFENVFKRLKDIENLKKHYGVSRTVISKWLKEVGIDYKGITAKKPDIDPELLEDLNKNKRMSSSQISNLLNVSPTFIVKQFSKNGLYIKQYNRYSKSENEVIDYVNSLGCNFKKDKKILNGLELDGYDSRIKVAIEYNGLYWHSSDRISDSKYHQKKYMLCKENNIKLYTIFENEWINKKPLVSSMLAARVGVFDYKIGARNTNISEVSISEVKKFMNDNHISGFLSYNKAYGLLYEGELISVMTFNIPRFNKHYEWEIGRFASKSGFHVNGAASKLFSIFKKECNPTSVISYADLRYGNGNVYEQLGFSFKGISKPNYFYFKNRSLVLESRVKYQKHKLNKLLITFDPNKTEMENMKENGYSSIFDCGNAKWVWSKTPHP